MVAVLARMVGVPMTPASNTPIIRRFLVRVHQDANDLDGSVEVICTSEQAAKDMARRLFFHDRSWKIVDVTRGKRL